MPEGPAAAVRALEQVHRSLDACRACPRMVGPVVHGPAVATEIFLLGQAPGPHEGRFGKPFAWTAGKTLFKWLFTATGADEAAVRERIYFAAVARCFPGKNPKGGDRKPDGDEIARCRDWLEREVTILRPRLVLAVGALAIDQLLGEPAQLKERVGRTFSVTWHSVRTEVVPLPHPSGASTWHLTEPGKSLLPKALELIARHGVTREVFGRP